MGVLWIAEHQTLGTEVVVKFLKDELVGERSGARRIAQEAAAAARVRSPHVVQVFDHGVSADGVPFIVMERLVGCDLREYLDARGALPIRETIAIVHQLAKALDRTHEAGLVHRDVKPSNIFLCDFDGEIFLKLLDFGLAKRPAPDRLSSTGSHPCAGTAPYMSPEQIVGGTVGSRSDIWALGVVTFECLTGDRAFDGETLGAVALAVHTLSLPSMTERRPELPSAIDAWFQRACARSSEERYESAMQAAEAMASALGVEVPPAPSRPPIPVAPHDDRTITDDFTLTRGAASRRPRRRPALTVAASVFTFAAIVFAAREAHRAAAQPPQRLTAPVGVAPPEPPRRSSKPSKATFPPEPPAPAADPAPSQAPLAAHRPSPTSAKLTQAPTTIPAPAALIADPKAHAARADDLPDERY